MTTARIELPPKLIPVFTSEADVRGAYGGRGSGKTRSFAKMAGVKGYQHSMAGREGVILCGRQFQNSLAESSFAEVKAAIQSEPWLAEHYDIGERYIRTIDGRVEFIFRGLERNIDSLKSTARILLAWIDEAEPVTEEAWTKLIPTLREEQSELWVTWNPESKRSPTHKRFREATDPRMKVVELNWRDNPRFPTILERQRLRDKDNLPDKYEHIWEGDFLQAHDGAYYAAAINEARRQGRIGRVNADPLLKLRAFWDIGWTDATAIWIVQYVGQEIRILDHYESVNQPLSVDLQWLRDNGYEKALCVLPHDGRHHNKVTGKRFSDHIDEAGFETETIPNQGRAAYMQRIEAARRIFPSIWFNEETCEAGIEALAWYHERRDEERGIGLGAMHDWSSHSADAFGLMAVCYEGPEKQPEPGENDPHRRAYYRRARKRNTNWMAA